jgi:L-rhamnose mutarotase
MKISLVLSVPVCLSLFSCKHQQKDSPDGVYKSDMLSNAAARQEPGRVNRRVGMITGIKPDKIAYYKQLHANVWPAVLEKIEECHIRNYSIYLKKIGDKYFLFSYFEYTGTDMDRDMQKMAADSITQRWWKETDPAQIPLPEAAAKKKIWADMEELFHTN